MIPSSKEAMLNDYATWTPKIRELLKSMQKTDIWALFNHPSARTYWKSKPRICLAGDAAHASTPHQGAGAGMCVEDCYILGELLGDATGVQDLEKVFHAYDEVRRPRSLKLVGTSREAGMLYDFEGPEGDDLEAIERNLKQRMSWLWDADMTVELERARSIMRDKV